MSPMQDVSRLLGIALAAVVIVYATYLLTRGFDNWVAWTSLVIGILALGVIIGRKGTR
jgi:hypothetical protein